MKLYIKNAVARFPEFRFEHPVDWTIHSGESWAVIGPNGAGKTLLTDYLQCRIALQEGEVGIEPETEAEIGRRLYEVVKSISFRDIYSLSDCRGSYYQQRWNSSDAEHSPAAGSLLGNQPGEKIARYAALFGIGELLGKRLVSLSSGELRKFLITRTLLSDPGVLILDNPFIGLDAATRDLLGEMLRKMSCESGVQVILALSNPDDIPDWITHVLPVCRRDCLPALTRKAFMDDKALLATLFPEKYSERGKNIPDLPAPLAAPGKNTPYDIAIRMEAVTVRYDDRTILQDVDWTVRPGEKWALLGENGSGKSTLLSLVCGDNPQAYANHLTLFGRRRGTGESIWDIKRRIGYLSPDVHTYYLQDIPCLQVVASGFYDSVGLYNKCTPEQTALAEAWLETFGAAELAERSFVKISYGEQRLVLLARALVKDPELLILDEPLHGLDTGKKQRVKALVEAFCSRPGKTLIYVTHYLHEIPSCVTLRKTLVKNRG